MESDAGGHLDRRGLHAQGHGHRCRRKPRTGRADQLHRGWRAALVADRGIARHDFAHAGLARDLRPRRYGGADRDPGRQELLQRDGPGHPDCHGGALATGGGAGGLPAGRYLLGFRGRARLGGQHGDGHLGGRTGGRFGALGDHRQPRAPADLGRRPADSRRQRRRHQPRFGRALHRSAGAAAAVLPRGTKERDGHAER